MSVIKLVAVQPTKQQLADYVNAVGVVNNYAYAITNQALPVLSSPPKNYGEFTTNFGPAKGHALNWTDNLFVEMLQLPVTVKDQAADLFDFQGTMIEAYLTDLVNDPTSAKAKAGLHTALTALSSVIQAQLKTITNIETGLAGFISDIATDAKTLTGIAQGATDDAGADKAQIVKINNDIAALKKQIATENLLVTVSDIGIGVSIFVGLVGVWACLIPGGQLIGGGMIILAVGGLAGSIAGTVIGTKAVAAMQASIDADQKQITGLNQDIILLNGVSSQFNDLYNANLKAQTALTAIKSMWKSLDDTVTEVKTDLASVDKDTTAAQYQQALTEFKAAETNWKDVVTFADVLAGLDFKWQDAKGNWHSFSSTGAAGAGNVTPIPSTIKAA